MSIERFDASKAVATAKDWADKSMVAAEEADSLVSAINDRVQALERFIEEDQEQRRLERAQDALKNLERVSAARRAKSEAMATVWQTHRENEHRRIAELEEKLAELEARKRKLQISSTKEQEAAFESEDAKVHAQAQSDAVLAIHEQLKGAAHRELERVRVEMGTVGAEQALSKAQVDKFRLVVLRAECRSQEAAQEVESLKVQLRELEDKNDELSEANIKLEEDLMEELRQQENEVVARDAEVAAAKKTVYLLEGKYVALTEQFNCLKAGLQRTLKALKDGDLAQEQVRVIFGDVRIKTYYLDLLTNLKSFFTACEAIQSKMVERQLNSLKNLKEILKEMTRSGTSGFWNTIDQKTALEGIVDLASDDACCLSGIPCVRAAGATIKVLLGTVVERENKGPCLGRGAEFLILAAAQQRGGRHLSGGGEAVLECAARELALKRRKELDAASEAFEEESRKEEAKTGTTDKKARCGFLSELFCSMVKASGVPGSFRPIEGAGAGVAAASTGEALYSALFGERSDLSLAQVAALADTTAIAQAILAGNFSESSTLPLEKFIVSCVLAPPPEQEQQHAAAATVVVATDGSGEDLSTPFLSASQKTRVDLESELDATAVELEKIRRENGDAHYELEAAQGRLRMASEALEELKAAVKEIQKQGDEQSVRNKSFSPM
jgi:hypothetical protein